MQTKTLCKKKKEKSVKFKQHIYKYTIFPLGAVWEKPQSLYIYLT